LSFFRGFFAETDGLDPFSRSDPDLARSTALRRLDGALSTARGAGLAGADGVTVGRELSRGEGAVRAGCL
jgi:hypothetical protein